MPDRKPPTVEGTRVARAHAAMREMPVGYRELLDRLTAAAADDARVRAMWLGGSVGRGVADSGSDLDVLVTVRDDQLADFAANWRTWLESFASVLLARELPGLPGSFFATTTDCLRVDVVVEPSSGIASTPYRNRLSVLDHDGLTVSRSEPATGPDRDTVSDIIEEFYRQQAIFPAAVVSREDWLLGVVGVHNIQILLYRLLTACNEPLPPMGVKQWSARLTPSQRQLMAALPQPRPIREEVVAAMRAVRAAFRTDAREIVDSLGFEWPEVVDEAVTAYWRVEGLADD